MQREGEGGPTEASRGSAGWAHSCDFVLKVMGGGSTEGFKHAQICNVKENHAVCVWGGA